MPRRAVQPAPLPMLLNQRQAAKLLGKSPDKVRAWTKAGVFDDVLFTDPESGWVFYRRPALERWALDGARERRAS